MVRKQTEEEKRLARITNSRHAAEERAKLERRKQALSFAGSGEGLTENSVSSLAVQSHATDDLLRAIGMTHLKNASVGPTQINDSFRGGSQNLYRARRIGGAGSWSSTGSSEDSSSANHAHSIGFKTNFTQEQRKAYLAVLHELEAIKNPSPVERMTAMLARMTADDPDRTAEELIDFLDNGDPFEVHIWRVDHEHEYHAREMLIANPAYRANALRHPVVRRIAQELEIDYAEPVSQKEEEESVIAVQARMRFLEEFPEVLRENRQHNRGRLLVDRDSSKG